MCCRCPRPAGPGEAWLQVRPSPTAPRALRPVFPALALPVATTSPFDPKVWRVLFVCMGNICRSPTAEAIARQKLQRAGIDAWVKVDSAGTHGYHVGSPPDPRAQSHAQRRGYDLSALRGRQVGPTDFARFDLILAMDWDNLALLEESCPEQHRRKLRLLMEFAPDTGSPTVPDPYYGGPQGFENTLNLIEAAVDGLVAYLEEGGTRPSEL